MRPENSKYNTGRSMRIDEIPKEELEQAIKEWSHYQEPMERLLWKCIEEGVETTGCHPEARPYLEFKVNNSQEKIKQMLNAIQEFVGASVVLIPDGAPNLCGVTSEWDRPCFSIGCNVSKKEQVMEVLESLYTALSNNIKEKEKAFEQMLEFYDFFKEKESQLRFYMERPEQDLYDFSIRYANQYRENFEFYDRLFRKAGMELVDEEFRVWSILADNEESFTEKVKRAKQIIFEGYTLGIPQEITLGMPNANIARIKRRQFGDTPEGKTRFAKWFEEFRSILWESINDRISYDQVEKFKMASMETSTLEQSIQDRTAYSETFASGLTQATDMVRETINSQKEAEQEIQGEDRDEKR